MAAPIGNRFWELRSSHGRNPIFPNPEALWDACTQYFEWTEENPLWESKIASDKGEPKVVTLPKMRAMTITGLCLFLGIDQTTWKDYGTKKDFSRIVREAEEVIYSQKFAGAAANLLNANIIARDLGLSDKKELTGAGGGPIKTISADMDPVEAARIYREMIGGGGKAE